HAFETPALPSRFRKRQQKQDTEQHEQTDRRRRRVEQVPPPDERGESESECKRDRAGREQCGMPGLPAWRDPNEREAEQREARNLERQRPRGSREPRLVVKILEHLRLDLAAWHALAQWRVLIVDHCQAACADENELLRQAQAVHFAVENVDRG